MKSETKLYITKQIVNLAVRVLNRFIPAVTPSYPQTRMMADIFKNCYKVWMVEDYANRFGDKNFLRFLQLAEKLLVYLGEKDRYYRQWLGLGFLLCCRELRTQVNRLSYEDFLASTLEQWELDYSQAVPREYFEAHKTELLEIMLTDYLSNLAKINLSRDGVYKIKTPKRSIPFDLTPSFFARGSPLQLG